MAGEWDVVASQPVVAQDPWAVVGTQESKVVEAQGKTTSALQRMRNVGGETAAIADLILGAPNFLVRTGVQLGGAVRAAGQGDPNPIARGREAGAGYDEMLSEIPVLRAAATPLKGLWDAFGSGEYDGAVTTQALHKLTTLIEDAGTKVEKATGGRIPRDAMPMFVETLMAGMVGIGSGRAKPAIAPHVQKALREQAVRLKEQGELELAAERPATPQEAEARAPVQQQINELLGIRTPAEQAQVTRRRRQDVRTTFGEQGPSAEPLPDEIAARGTREYGDAGESIFRADERMAQEKMSGMQRILGQLNDPQVKVGQAEMLEILQKGERTGEDLSVLRKAERGEATPEALALAASVGIGTVAGTLLDDDALRGASIGAMTGAAFALPHMFRGESLGSAKWKERGAMGLDTRSVTDALMTDFAGADKTKWTPQAKKNAADYAIIKAKQTQSPQQKALYEQAAKVLRGEMPEPGMVEGGGARGPGKGQLGAVKAPGGMWHPEAVERLAEPLKKSLLDDVYRQQADDIMGGALTRKEAQAAAKPLEDWTQKSIKRYLDRYAGTEKDPLKDVEIPFGEGTRRWDQVVDESIVRLPAKELDPRAKEGEFGYTLYPKDNYQTPQALSSYLSHVGDYLRQNVDPAKLPQYDLVRAVRETFENDKRVAKEMEKAAVASTKDLPVHKDYGDGFKWVELKLPEKLTEEQKKTVRKATTKEKQELDTQQGIEATQFDSSGRFKQYNYIAVDAKGKPLENSYTREVAGGTTPEEAYLAGRLAEEGNQMGHCVGGYCEGVASGESKIFSLRDAKGQSHVTVEASKPDVRRYSPIDFWNERASKAFKEDYPIPADPKTYEVKIADSRRWRADVMDTPEFKEWLSEKPADVQQIKGKQNRAPDAKYLPYVQDFVKEGKWGEVRDLENSRLLDTNPSRSNSKEFNSLAEELFPGQRFLTEADYKRLNDEGTTRTIAERDKQLGVEGNRPIRRRLGDPEAGAIDQQLVMGLGTFGLGGLVGSLWADDPVNGGVLGVIAAGALGLPGTKGALKQAVAGLEYAGGMASTRIKNASPALHQRLITFEQRTREQVHKNLTRITRWLKESTNLPTSRRSALDAAIFMKDADAIAAINKGNPEIVAGWREVRNTLVDLGKKAQDLGRFKELIDDYFPQRVKDYEGLKEAMGQQVRRGLEAKIAEAEVKARKRGANLSDTERDAIINRALRSHYEQLSRQPGYSKPRVIEKVTSDLQQFYFTPQEALAITVSEITKDLEIAKLFGKDLVQRKQEGRSYVDLDASIGNVLGRELKEGKLTPESFREVESILRSRFGPGERSQHRALQNAQNLSYAALLADLPSAIVQLADPALSIPAHGLRATITAMARKLSGNAKITSEQMSLMDHTAEDLAFGSTQAGPSRTKTRIATGIGAAAGAVAGAVLQDDIMGAIPGAAAGAFAGYAKTVGTAAALNRVLKQGVFAPIDRFGKDIQLGAAHAKASRWASSKEGLKNLENAYGEAFREEFPLLVADLKAGRMSERVRSMLLAELSRTQPISKLEAPQALLDHPNARIVYMLKRFMLKQADFIRREAYNNIKEGYEVGGEKGLAQAGKGIKSLTEFVTVLGLSGATAAMLQNWILGREVKFEATDVMENVLKTFGLSRYVMDKMKEGGAGPIQAIGAGLLPPFAVMDRIITADPKAVQYIPVIGQLYYNWELGGREEAELRAAREAKKEGKDYSLSGRAEALKERKRELRRAKREEQR